LAKIVGVTRVGVAVSLLVLTTACGATKTITTERTVTQVRTVTTGESTTSKTAAPACTGSEVRATFAAVPGSAGAGNIVYRLVVTNTSRPPCFVSGLPQAQLLDANDVRVPTHVSAAQPGEPTAARIVLEQGRSASADARFSPDVPGPGEPVNGTGSCEPTAATLRIAAPGGGDIDAPVRPRTPVCEHGALRFSVFTAAR
jgi:hypothetical protein